METYSNLHYTLLHQTFHWNDENPAGDGLNKTSSPKKTSRVRFDNTSRKRCGRPWDVFIAYNSAANIIRTPSQRHIKHPINTFKEHFIYCP